MTCQAPLSMGLPRQEYWNGLPVPSLGDLPDTGIKRRSPTLQVDSLPPEPPGKSCKVYPTVTYTKEVVLHLAIQLSDERKDSVKFTGST